MAGRDMSVYVNIEGRVAGSLASSIKTVEGRLTGLTNHFKRQVAAQKAAIRGMMDSFKGMAAFAAAGGLAFSLKKAFGAGADFAAEVQKLRAAGRSAKEVAEGIDAANKSIKNLPTASLTGSIKLLNETTGAFGDYHHAVENLDFNSKLATVLKLGSGSEDPEHDIGSLIKALEIRGSASDPAKYRREAGELQRAMAALPRLHADEINTFARNSQQGIQGLSERALTKYMPTLINELGGAGAGTGLTAFRTIISGRKISDQAQAKAWQDLGLLSKKDIIVNKKNGEIKGWRDGAIRGTALAYKDPMEFLWKVVIPRLKKNGVDTADPVKLQAALNTLFKNTKAAAFVSAIGTVVNKARLKKDEKLINDVLDLDKQYAGQLRNNPRAALAAVKTAFDNLGVALTGQLQSPAAEGLVRLARAIQTLSASINENPMLARALGGIAVGLSAMAGLRLFSIVFGLQGLARATASLALASTFGLAARLVGVARGIAALSIAATVGLATRLRSIAVGILAVNAIGGGRMALTFVAASIARFGLAVAAFPLVALRAVSLAMWGLVANPVGIAITGIVVALTALGTWVYNNWSGIKTFFGAFGSSFMKALGPGAASSVQTVVDAVKGVWDWFSKLLGPLDRGGAKWKAWGEAAGAGAAAVVNALTSLPSTIAKLFTDFNWAGIGSAIGNGLKSGIGAIGSFLFGGSAEAAPAAAPGKVPGRYAGGPVTGGSPYIVGERGPELFVPGGSGRIVPNNALRPTVDASAVARTRALANETGMVLHNSLDATRKPIVDTSSIDEAAMKVASLGSALGRLEGAIGGGGGGSDGGSWNGRALPVGGGAGVGHVASQADRAAFITSYAKSIGMNPATALRVAQSEGFSKYTGDQGRSFGDFQLFTGGGVGNRALRAGIDVRDPRQWKAADRFALDTAKREGWSQWHGARRVGIGNWQGINAGNREIARMADPEAVARLRGKARGDIVHHHNGDSHHSPTFVIHAPGGDVHKVKAQVEDHFWTMVRQAERDQAGSLSD